MDNRPKKLLDQVRQTIQLKHYSSRTGETCIGWVLNRGALAVRSPLD